ncbi:hypothetical protein BH24ACT3_BH24ACT3_09540 [soil metagenome]
MTPVRWRESVLALADLGVTDVVEAGADGHLGPLVRRTARDLALRAVTGTADLAGGDAGPADLAGDVVRP